jgi:hypothetical protein
MIFQLLFYIEMDLCCGTAERRRGNAALGKYILPIKVKNILHVWRSKPEWVLWTEADSTCFHFSACDQLANTLIPRDRYYLENLTQKISSTFWTQWYITVFTSPPLFLFWTKRIYFMISFPIYIRSTLYPSSMLKSTKWLISSRVSNQNTTCSSLHGDKASPWLRLFWVWTV